MPGVCKCWLGVGGGRGGRGCGWEGQVIQGVGLGRNVDDSLLYVMIMNGKVGSPPVCWVQVFVRRFWAIQVLRNTCGGVVE